jgi:hypothetical protein
MPPSLRPTGAQFSVTIFNCNCHWGKQELSEGIKLSETKCPELDRGLGTQSSRISHGDTPKLLRLVSRIKVSSVPTSKWLQIQNLLIVSVEQVQPHQNNSPAGYPTSPRRISLLCCASVATVRPPFCEPSLSFVHIETALADSRLALLLPKLYVIYDYCTTTTTFLAVT